MKGYANDLKGETSTAVENVKNYLDQAAQDKASATKVRNYSIFNARVLQAARLCDLKALEEAAKAKVAATTANTTVEEAIAKVKRILDKLSKSPSARFLLA